MLSYWKNKTNNQLMQINQFETPSVYHNIINNNNWVNITQEEYESLMPKEEVKIDYNPVAESVKRTEPVERYF